MGYSLAVKYKTSEELEKMNNFYMSNLDIVKDLSDAEGRWCNLEKSNKLKF